MWQFCLSSFSALFHVVPVFAGKLFAVAFYTYMNVILAKFLLLYTIFGFCLTGLFGVTAGAAGRTFGIARTGYFIGRRFLRCGSQPR